MGGGGCDRHRERDQEDDRDGELGARLAEQREAGADQVNDVVSCPGTDSCKLGITSSMGLNRAVQELSLIHI